MNGSDDNVLFEASLKARLTPEDEARVQAYLRNHPAAHPAWEEELRLNHLLRQLPDAPLSSNFTSQVLQAVQQDHRQRQPNTGTDRFERFRLANWIRKIAVTAAVVAIGIVSYQQHRLSVRKELARSVAVLSPVATVPTVEMLQNFEAIKRLNQVPRDVDVELIAALQ